MQVKCDVFRFDPDSHGKTRYDTYMLEVQPMETVLGLLIRIGHHFDSSLSFRFSCGVVKCGECAIMVNGTPCLACEKVVEAEMKIDPLPNLPLIKDLVIDRKKVFDRIVRGVPPLSETVNARDRLHTLTPETADRFVRLTKCFECLMCQSSCPVYGESQNRFIGPLGLLWLAQMSSNPASEAPSKVDVQSSLDLCQRCGLCSDVCPCTEDILGLALDTLEKA
jgi:succinate dehydrogenase/fumarate reductase iron-sulfur protein